MYACAGVSPNSTTYLYLQTSGRSLAVKLFHFNSWLANESPSMDAMLRLMGEVQKEQERGAKRVLVMCEYVIARLYFCAGVDMTVSSCVLV